MEMLFSNPTKDHSSQWLVNHNPNQQAKFRLFCFPYAGAGAVVFHAWPNHLPKSVEVVSIQLPGREGRINEAPFTSIQPLLAALQPQIEPFLDLPFAFYGHSLGALLAFGFTRRLRKQGGGLPTHLFFSGRRAPHIPDPRQPMYALPDPAFVKAIQERYNGIPQVIFQDSELMSVFMSLLRADVTISETYQYLDEPAFSIPLSVYGGSEDPNASCEELAAWEEHTDRAFTLQMFPGDHFFIRSQISVLLKTLNQELTPYL